MPDPFIDVCSNILETARRIKHITEPWVETRTVSPVAPNAPVISISLDLPAPADITPALINLGLKHSVVDQLNDTYLRVADELRTTTMDNLRKTISSLATLPDCAQDSPMKTQENVFRAYKARYEHALASMVESYLQGAKERISQNGGEGASMSLHEHTRKTKAKQFNHYYVPLLEHYFAENPLPSHADKNFLAKKCAMTFRQIHVWFQNRRNRTRKKGQVFKRKPQHELGKLPLDTLIAKMPHSIIPEDQRVKYVDSDTSEYEWQYESSENDASSWVEKHPREPNPVDVFDIPTPLYAFPAVYPSEIEHEPFPRDWKASFPPPQWDRRPAKAPSKRPPMVEFEEFSEIFSLMSVKERPRKRWRIKKSNDPQKRAKTKRTSSLAPKPDRSAATIFITTKPPAAPLAAFIRPTTVPRCFLVPPLPTVPAPPSRKRIFESLDPTPTPTTLVATPLLRAEELTSPKTKSSSRRKIAPLPRRVPNGTSVAHRAMTPAASSISVSSEQESPSPSSSSRSPSSESSSKRIRLSSDSGSASEVATPEPSPLSLPTDIPPPVLSIADFNLDSPSTMNDLFCENPADHSQVDKLQLAFPSGSAYGANEGNKDPIFGFEFDQSFLHIQS
ncbi:hypothetical protein PILCRDRAFT_813626 [Piloderma croceum F 1598]|uniref:Homeobox domain-containing protein n=1 Tax=Piloderma croceum (strain F 1598) TaxID=765440 RepID=A0A0C3FWX8_PILCF|nr:hypothetical protein PILCRDRAFT_813626 [Piloderma croceum F 1598]